MTALDICKDIPKPSLKTDDDLKNWASDQAEEHKLQYMLAHADDGVIWGHFRTGKLSTSDTVLKQSPPLRLITLQKCRIFGSEGEALLWKASGQWKARFVGNPGLESIPEPQILWGTKGEEFPDEGFTILQDGSQGLIHAVPITGIKFAKAEKNHRPVRLLVHHFIDYDDDGLARIVLSRLVDLTIEGKQEVQP